MVFAVDNIKINETNRGQEIRDELNIRKKDIGRFMLH